MAIFLTILKIIGIVLLSVLGLIILALLLVLFVPFRYKFDANYYDTYHISCSVSYLLHILTYKCEFTKEGKKDEFRLFGISVERLKKIKYRKHASRLKNTIFRSDKPKPTETQAEQVSDIQPDISKEDQLDEFEFDEFEDVQPDIIEDIQVVKSEDNLVEKTEDVQSDKAMDQHSFFDKIKSFFVDLKNKCIRCINGIKEKIISIKDGSKDFKENTFYDKKYTIEAWLNVLKREQTKRALARGKEDTKKLLKHLLPRKWNGYIHVGFENPATTATVTEYYWMSLGIFTNHVLYIPEFNQVVHEGFLKGKGKVQVIQLVIAMFKLMKDKDYIYLRKISEVVDREKEKLIRRANKENREKKTA